MVINISFSEVHIRINLCFCAISYNIFAVINLRNKRLIFFIDRTKQAEIDNSGSKLLREVYSSLFFM